MMTTRGPRRSWLLGGCAVLVVAVWVAAALGSRWATALVSSAGLVALTAALLRVRSPRVQGAASPVAADSVSAGPTDGALVLAALDEATERLAGAGQLLLAATEESGIQSQLVATAAEEVLNDVSAASTMSEELAAAMRVIATDSADVARAGSDAAALVGTTAELASKLGESSHEIEGVLRVIGTIASQTNMLALNATIEAARSGEAGKGFKVVAGEVKDLARATDTATKNIEVRVQAMQSDSGTVVQAIDQISVVINHVNEAQATIASSVQRTASGDLDQRLGEAVSGAMAIAMNLGTITDSTARAHVSATDVVAGIEAVRVAARELAARL